jgi:hypothetical protein
MLLLQCLDLRFDQIGIKPSHLIRNQLSASVKEKEGWHATDAVSRSQLAAHATDGAQPQDLSLVLQVSLQPVHDRLCQEAGASGVGVELDEGGSTVLENSVHFGNRADIAAGGTEEEKGADNPPNDEEEEPILP